MDHSRPKKEKPTTVLTPEEYAAVDKAQLSFEAGKGMTFDEAIALMRKRHKAWMGVTPEKTQTA